MRWPSSWASSSPSPPPDPEDKRSSSKTTPPSKPLSDATPTASPPPHKPVTWNSILNATDWSSLTSPRTLIPTLLLTTSILGFYKFYRSYLRRIPAATAISPGYFRRRSILGKVVAVGDGDNFRVYHTPGGRLAGWGWLPGRRVPEQKKELKNRTVGRDEWLISLFERRESGYANEIELIRRVRYTSASLASTPQSSLISAVRPNPTHRMLWIG